MNHSPVVKRPYRSSLREAQAATTRNAIVDAAARAFVERGYVATSMDVIAAAAGVSRATVFSAVGGKKALLKRAYDIALVGDDAPVSFAERPRSLEVRREPDPKRLLVLYVQLIVDMYSRLAPIHEAVRGAASADSEVREVWEQIGSERRAGAERLVAMLRDRDGLRPGIDPDAAADVMWVLNDPGLYHQLVIGRGWSSDRYARWLTDTMHQQLLSAEPSPNVHSAGSG